MTFARVALIVLHFYCVFWLLGPFHTDTNYYSHDQFTSSSVRKICTNAYSHWRD